MHSLGGKAPRGLCAERERKKNRKFKFGFARFNQLKDAKEAISRLDGTNLNGLPMKVTMARYPSVSIFKKKENNGNADLKRSQMINKQWRPKRIMESEGWYKLTEEDKRRVGNLAVASLRGY